MLNKIFVWQRLFAIMLKEFIQMKRDRATLAMMVGIPLLQVILFGFAINSDPKHLPTVLMVADHSPFVRTLIQGMRNSDYFKIVAQVPTEQQAKKLLATGDAQFVVNIPTDFSRNLVRGQRPQLLLEADATDPASVGNAVAAMNTLLKTVFQFDFVGNLSYLNSNNNKLNPLAMPTPPIDLIIHAKYNPAGITQYNIVTGLLGVVLTMTMTMTTAIAITRERDRGTMESLLATPAHPLEVMVGKILPFIIVGYVQVSLIILIGHFLFSVPVVGNVFLLFLLSLPFIAANLAVGITISTMAKNPLQAVQTTIFFFLPSILLSGFMFPFRGMPIWAQRLGEILPLTHYLRITRGILVKGNGFNEVWWQVVAIILFLLFILMVGAKRYRRTLD